RGGGAAAAESASREQAVQSGHAARGDVGQAKLGVDVGAGGGVELGGHGAAEASARVVEAQVVVERRGERVGVGDHRLPGPAILGAVAGGAERRVLGLDDGGGRVASIEPVAVADHLVDAERIALFV